jgi:CheY-like chemotaxis protein
MLGRLIGEHIIVKFTRREGLPAVEGDAGMLEQVLMNLAVNARDAMPDGGELGISIGVICADADGFKAKDSEARGQFLCLTVTDKGSGMDKATLDRIFEPFFTTKEPGKGTGLGLATVHGIVAQHKGWVEVESDVGKGTTFKVFLPASRQIISNEPPARKLEALKGHETVLVVEDEVGVRRLVTQSLRLLGYAVFEAENGRSAMAMWRERHGEFDLLFSDMVMPGGMTGLDLAQTLRQEKPGLKVIISSGYSAEIGGQSKLEADGIAYLQKPYRVELLSRAVRDCLNGHVK